MSSSISKLSPQERQTELSSIPSWTFDPSTEGIKKSFKFDSFPLAMGFIVTLGIEAQAVNHHPEMFNVYDRVDVVWRTHDCQGLSAKDIMMAKKCDLISKALAK